MRRLEAGSRPLIFDLVSVDAKREKSLIRAFTLFTVENLRIQDI